MNNLHYDINELQQQYTIYCQVLDQYTNQIEEKLSELKSFVDDDSSTSTTLSVLKENVNRQVIVNLEKIVEIFSQIKLKLNQVKEYYLSCCGEMSLDENDLIDNIKCVKQIISYYEDLDHSLHLTPEVNAQQEVTQILDQLHQLNNLYQNKIDSMYEFEQTIAHMFDNEIEELREIQLNMSEMKLIGGKQLSNTLLSQISNATQIDKLPNLDEYNNYNEYLVAVGKYAYNHGMATKHVINGVTYYEFTNKVKMNYYDTQIVDSQIIIIVNGNQTDVYMKYDLKEGDTTVPVLCVPNGMLAINSFAQVGTNDKDYPIYKSGEVIGEGGNYQDFFSVLLSGDYNPDNQIVETVNKRTNNYDKLDDKLKTSINDFVDQRCDANKVNDLAEHILAYDASNGGEETRISEAEIENQAKLYTPKNQDFAYFAGEIQMHADGVQNQKNIDLMIARGIYGLWPFNKEEHYDEAMKNADMAKGPGSGFSARLNDNLQQYIIEHDYKSEHREIWMRKKWWRKNA